MKLQDEHFKCKRLKAMGTARSWVGTGASVVGDQGSWAGESGADQKDGGRQH